MTGLKAYELTMEFRQKLIENGKRLSFQNPDRLSMEELQATTLAIFRKLNEIDMANGYEYHDVGIKLAPGISEERVSELFINFIDWYNIIGTQSNQIYDFVLKHYPTSKFKKVLCVGDGEYSHLGRKLADKGYNVVSVDPEAKREFKGKIGQGKLYIVNGEFHGNSTDMISWADLIVGAKVPLCIEDLSQVAKPAVFNIGTNPEMYNMRFKGTPITSYEQYIEEIKKCPHVKCEKVTDDKWEKESYIFYHDGIKKEKDIENR